MKILVYRFITFFFGLFPQKVVFFFGKWIGDIVDLFLPIRKAIVEKNILILFNEISKDQIKKIRRDFYRNIAVTSLEILKLPKIDSHFFKSGFEVYGREHLDKAFEKKRGVLILTAHFSNWELLCYYWTRLGYPLDIVARDLAWDFGDGFIKFIRRSCGVGIIPAKNVVYNVQNSLSKNRAVGFVQDIHVSHRGAVEACFSGKIIKSTPLLPLMHHRTGAPVLPVHMVRDWSQTSYRIVFEPEIEFTPLDEDFDDWLVKNTTLCNSYVERWIKEHPSQWLLGHRLFKHSIDYSV